MLATKLLRRNHYLVQGFFRRTFAAVPRVLVGNCHLGSTPYFAVRWESGFLTPRFSRVARVELQGHDPRLELLITNIISRYLCISDSDLPLWGRDPLEYVRKTYDVLDEFNTPRAATCSLLSMRSIVAVALISARPQHLRQSDVNMPCAGSATLIDCSESEHSASLQQIT